MLSLSGILTACAPMTASDAPKGTLVSSAPPDIPMTFCLVAKPIFWSPKDTDETIKQVKLHNAAGKALCGWGPSPPSVVSP